MAPQQYNSSLDEFRAALAAGHHEGRPRRYDELLASLASEDGYVYLMIYPGEGSGQVAMYWPTLGGVSAYTMMETGGGGWWHCVLDSDPNVEFFRCRERSAVVGALTREGWEPLERDRFRLGVRRPRRQPSDSANGRHRSPWVKTAAGVGAMLAAAWARSQQEKAEQEKAKQEQAQQEKTR